jgi:hypothetical protein
VRSRWRARCGSVFGEVRCGEDQHATMGARVGPREGLGWVGRRRELVEVRARGDSSNGGSAGGCAHTREELGAPFYSQRAQR